MTPPQRLRIYLSDHFMLKVLILALSTMLLSTITQAKQELSQAQLNFDNNCVRALATPALIKEKLQQHHFKLENTEGNLPIPFGIETAQLGQKQSIQLKNSGCEYYTFDITLILNTEKIERQQKLCQQCLITELKNIGQYFQLEERQFYLSGIEILEQQFKQQKSFQVGKSYQLNYDEEMPQVFLFNQIKKQSNGQYSIKFSNTLGPL